MKTKSKNLGKNRLVSKKLGSKTRMNPKVAVKGKPKRLKMGLKLK